MFSLLVSSVLAFSAADAAGAKLDSTATVALVPAASALPRSSFDRVGKWQLGVAGGSSTGGGLAARYWWDAKNGVEVHGYFWLSKDNFPNDDESGYYNQQSGMYSGSRDTGSVATGEFSLGVQYLHEVFRSNFFEPSGSVFSSCQVRGLTFAGVGAYADYEDRSMRISRYVYSMRTNLITNPQNGGYQMVNDEYHVERRRLMGGLGGGLEFEVSRISVHLMYGYGMEYGLTSSSYGYGSTVDGGIFFRF